MGMARLLPTFALRSLHRSRKPHRPVPRWSVPFDGHTPRPGHFELAICCVPSGDVGSLNLNVSEHGHSWHAHVRARADGAHVDDTSTGGRPDLDDKWVMTMATRIVICQQHSVD